MGDEEPVSQQPPADEEQDQSTAEPGTDQEAADKTDTTETTETLGKPGAAMNKRRRREMS